MEEWPGRPSERHSVPFDFESYHKRKKKLEEKYGKLINVRPYNDELANNKIASDKQQKYVKEIQDISDQEGLKRA